MPVSVATANCYVIRVLLRVEFNKELVLQQRDVCFECAYQPGMFFLISQ